MRSVLAIGVVSVLLVGHAHAQDEIKLSVVKYDGLRDAVAKERGKVVLVDFWGEF